MLAEQDEMYESLQVPYTTVQKIRIESREGLEVNCLVIYCFLIRHRKANACDD